MSRLPVILTGQALMSLRDSGFSLPTALAEVVDNSIEARANRIRIQLEETEEKGRKLVHRIVVSDDGEGMDPETLWRTCRSACRRAICATTRSGSMASAPS
jgi:archaeosine-15-forming tRNA-guanine transglycosylase